jgi:hypothetical protein
MMFCPNCGNQAAVDQKICRSCGMNLQKVAPALAEHLAEFGTGQSGIESAKDLRPLAVRRVDLLESSTGQPVERKRSAEVSA